MIRLKNLLIEQRVKAIIKRAPEPIAKKAADIYSMAFRVKEISIDKIGSKGQKQWHTLSNEDLISFLKDDPDIGASSKYADESYYIVGTDLKSKSQKREVYDILILKKFRVINVVNGKRIYSDINDYLTSKPSAIGSIGTSEIITFKDFYDSINPTANIGEKTEKDVEITGKYLQQTIGAILDPDNTAAIGSAERIAIKKAKEEKQKAEDDARKKADEENRVNQEWRDVFSSAIADKQVYWSAYNTTIDTNTVYYFMQLTKVQKEDPDTYEYISYSRQLAESGGTNLAGKGSNDGKIFTISFEKLKEKFSKTDSNDLFVYKINRYISNEEFTKILAINDASIFNYLKTKLLSSVTNVETNNKILIDYTFKTHGKQQLTKTKILELFGISDVSANTMSLKSVMTAGSLQSMIIQLLLKRDVVPTLKNDTGWMSHIETTCLVGGKNVLAIYDAIPSPVDGDYGTKSQNMMRIYAYVYNNLDHGSTAWAKILKDVNAAWPTMKFLNDTVLFKDFSPIIESRHVSLKSLLQEKNNLTYDFLFEIIKYLNIWSLLFSCIII